VHGEHGLVSTIGGGDVEVGKAGVVDAVAGGGVRGGGQAGAGSGIRTGNRDAGAVERGKRNRASGFIRAGCHARLGAPRVDRIGHVAALRGGVRTRGDGTDVHPVDRQVTRVQRADSGGAAGVLDRLVSAQRGDVGIGKSGDVDGFALVGANLERLRGEAAVEQLGAVEVGGVGNAVDLRLQLVDFLLQRCAVVGRVGGVARLHGQLADALQVVADLAQRAFSGLRERDAVVGVAGGLVHAAD